MGSFFNKAYLKDLEKGKEIYASPLYADKSILSQMPPTLIITAENDELKNNGYEYFQKLKQAGAEADYHCFANSSHGFTTAFHEDSRIARALTQIEQNEAEKAFELTAIFLRKIFLI